jgi:hypothetical protein
MKEIKSLITATLLCAFAVAPMAGVAADQKSEKAKPYPLKTCVVSDEKLGEMGDAYVFTYQGREIKLCCKSCLKDFKKDPAKYIKKIEEAEAKAKKAKS